MTNEFERTRNSSRNKKLQEIRAIKLDLIEKTGKPVHEIQYLITKKVKELSGLISEEGACYIIANDLGVKLKEDKKPSKRKKLRNNNDTSNDLDIAVEEGL